MHDLVMVTTPDGRRLEVLSAGPAGVLRPGDVPLVFHNGTPTGAQLFGPMTEAAAARGLRLVTWSRPGYGRSDEQPDRTVASVVADTRAVMDHLGAERLVSLGWSGGGPHALACGALLPEQTLAVATMGSVAPFGGEGLDFLAGMGPENIVEFGAALDGIDAVTPMLTDAIAELRAVGAAGVATAFGGLVDEVDRAVLTGPLAEWMAACLRHAVVQGIAGWRDDDLAFTRPWGFDVADVAVPVSLWQGDHDLMVPLAHGRWLADHLPTVRAHLIDGQGHLSLFGAIDEVVDDLLDAAGLSR